MSNAFLFAAGGTGGHVYPALSVATALRRIEPGARVEFVGGRRGIEGRLVPAANFVLHRLPAAGLRGLGVAGAIRFAFSFVLAFVASLFLLLRLRPDVVLATGGYATAAPAMAAAMLRRPLWLQEQNSVPGSTNRFLSRFAERVFIAFEEARAPLSRAGEIVALGNPVRREVMDAAAQTPDAADYELFGLEHGRPTLLVFGGSRGAATLAAAVRDGWQNVAENSSWQLLAQCSESELEATRRAASDRATVLPFIDRMDAAYRVADLVICRAGALTLAELTVLGKASVLVPFPYATDDHQTRNAHAFEAAGASMLVADADFDGARFSALTCELGADGDRLAVMGEAARTLASEADVAKRLATEMLESGEGGMSWTDRGLFAAPGDQAAPFRHTRRIHFVAIGGIGMSGIAEVLLHLGFEVSGSDLSENFMTQRLRGLGADVHIGHDADYVAGADVVVVSSAVPKSNPELVAALAGAIPIVRRAEMLAELMRLKHGIAVAGSHGKTTTSSLVATVLGDGGLDPTVIVGGKLLALGGNAILGQGQYLVAEADESDGTFLRLSPTLAIVTNVDREHLDHYRDMDHVRRAFVDFMERVPFYGKVIACAEDPELARLLPQLRWPAFTYGCGDECDLRMRVVSSGPEGCEMELHLRGERLGVCSIPLFGKHNALNATAAIACGLELGLDFGTIANALAGFGGVGRRLESKGQVGDVLIFDDYGHHPTELGVTLDALRDSFGERRLVVIFQPHRYTRTRDHHSEFADVLSKADVVGVLPIYEASEAPIVGISSELIVERLREHHGVTTRQLLSLEDACAWAAQTSCDGDIWLTQGAGDVTRLAEMLVSTLASTQSMESTEEDAS